MGNNVFLRFVNPSIYGLQWHPTPVLLPGKSHGQRSLVGYSPWGREELDMTKQLYFTLPCDSAGEESPGSAGDLSSISGLGRSPGERKGYPLQYSGLENSIDCIIHGVVKSRT